MILQRFFPGLLVFGLAFPPAVMAEEEQPRILLDFETSSRGLSQPAGTESESSNSSVAGSVPQIQLPSAGTAFFDSGDPLAVPVVPERDRGEDVMPVESRDWLLPLTPPTRLTDMVQVGASQPAPGVLRLTGEMVSTDFYLDLPENVDIPADLMLTLRSTVNILPDASTMTVGINAAAPVELPLNHLSGFETITIPAAGLTSGTNHLRLDLRQPHRIYCGPEASFNVWTEIHLPKSGVSLDSSTLSTDTAGLVLALKAQAAVGHALPVLVTEDEDPALLHELSEILGRALDGEMPVEFRSFYGLETPPFLTVALIASHRSHVELRKGATGGLVLQIEHVAGELPPLDEFLPPAILQPTGVPKLTPGSTTSLAELAQPDIIGNTRYFRYDIPFDLPEDWLLLSNQKGHLNLRYGFASMLPQGATLLVKMNDHTIRLLPLDRNGGRIQDPLDIIFFANLLHSGRNSLSLEMMVPGDPPDAVCPPRHTDLLVVTNDSTLSVPPAPPMTLAGMSKSLSELGPGGVMVPQAVSDRATLERLAAELAAGLASKAHSTDPSVQLNIVDISDVSVVPLDHSGASGRDLQAALVKKETAIAPDASLALSASPRTYRLTESDPPLADQIGTEAGSSASQDRRDGFAVGDWLARQARRLGSAAFVGSDEGLSTWLRTQQGSALLLRPNRAEPGELWLILGPQVSISNVQQGLIQLRDSRLASGEAAILTAGGSWQVWSAVRPPALLGTLKLSNVRTVLGNYVSWSPLLFTIALLGLAVLSTIPALLFILFTRRRGQL